MPELHALHQNHLLNALPKNEYEHIFSNLELIKMPLGMILYEPGNVLGHAYFPTTSIVSLIYDMESGASAEVAVIGNEGMIGTTLFMGGSAMPDRAIVQGAGYGYRLGKRQLMQELDRTGGRRHGALRSLLLLYTQALLIQIAQTAACNRHHTLDQQLCRWLLLRLDRLQCSELSVTQDLIANMLGVRREGVTEAAGRLKKAELIKYHRGHIEVLDRPGLEMRVCECYQVVKSEFDRLLPSN